MPEFAAIRTIRDVRKSSVLRAGVEHRLRELIDRDVRIRGAPEFAFVVFNSWRDNPVEAIQALLERSICELLPPNNSAENSRPVFCDALANWTATVGHIYIVLDQFEEYFLYHANERGENSFAKQFCDAVNRGDLRVNFLISIREDSLAKLDFFKGRIPGLFDNYLRIDHLDREAAREAIEAPIAKYNALYRKNEPTITIEPALTKAVLEEVKAGRLSFADVGAGGTESKRSSNLIETPYLQLVMTRLWNEEVKSRSTKLRLATLDKLGRAEKIVRTHLDETMRSLTKDEQEIAAEAFHYLVTPSGTKIAHYAGDLANYTAIPVTGLEPVLERLSTGRILILRKVAVTTDPGAPSRYEIFHDVLARAVLDWSVRFKDKRLFESITAQVQEKASKWRLGLTLIIVLAVAVVVLGYLLVQQRHLLDQQTRYTRRLEDQVRALQIAVVAKSKLADKDVDVPVLLARAAVEMADMPETESVLRKSLARNPSLLIMRAGKNPVKSAVFNDEGSLVLLSSSDGAFVWDLRTQKKLSQLDMAGTATVSAFSHRGDLAVTGTTQGEVCIWKPQTGEVEKCFFGHGDYKYDSRVTHIAFSNDDQYIVTAGGDQYARVWDRAGTEHGSLYQEFKVNWAEFSADGESVATAVVDNTARIWNWHTNVVKTLQHGSDRHKQLYVAKFDSTGKRIITASEDGTAKVWDTSSGKEIFKTDKSIHPVVDGSFSKDGTRIVTASGSTAEVWIIGGKRVAAAKEERGGMITSVSFSADGNFVLSACKEGLVVVSSARNGEPACRFGNQSYYSFNTAAYNPDEKSIMAAGNELTGNYSGGVARLWRICGPAPDNTAWEYSASVTSLMQAVDERIGRELTQIERDTYIP